MVEVGRGGTRQALFERDVIEGQVANRLSHLELGPSSLVFGRIDYTAEQPARVAGATEQSEPTAPTEQPVETATPTEQPAEVVRAAEPENTYYIGRIAVSDEHQEPVVVDWRARIAEPFFRATTQESLGLLRRRHFTTKGSKLLDIEDEIFEFDLFFTGNEDPSNENSTVETPTEATTDNQNPHNLRAHGALYAALQERRGSQMRDVVATIQADQDEIVREPMPGVLIIQGGPGTGKTVVALHRAAYLLYTNRFPLANQGVLVIGPNRLFLRYIERVLPSLGEVGAHLYVLADLFNDLFPNVRVTQRDTPATAEVKGSPKMVEVLANAVALRQRQLKTRLRLPFRASYLTLTPQQSREIIAHARKRFKRHNAAARFVENSVFATLTASQPQKDDPVAARRIAKLPEHLRDAAPVELIRERLGEAPALVEALEGMWPSLTPAQLLRDLFGSPALMAASAKDLLTEQEQSVLYRPRGESEASYNWSDADVPLLDEAYELLGPRRSRQRRALLDPEVRTFGHIVIDEAQDHSPMALRMIARRSLNGSMTIVGDVAQTTSPSAVADWQQIIKYLNEPRDTNSARSSHPLLRSVRQRELNLSYRIAGPSLEPANRVLAVSQPDVRPAVPVRANGPAPMFITADADGCVSAVVQTVQNLVNEGHSVLTVAPASLIDEVGLAMSKARVEFGRATVASRNATGALHQNVTLAPVELVKGLETDAVLVVEPAAIVNEEPRGLGALYVALTRATRQVAVVHSLALPAALRPETSGPEAPAPEVPKPETSGAVSLAPSTQS